MKNWLMRCAFLISGLGMVLAQEDTTKASGPLSTTTSRFRHELGIAAGFTTGFGPAYRLWKDRWGGQVCFTPINDGNMEIYSAGLSFMYSIAQTANSNFYVYQGNHFLSNTQYRAGSYEYNYTTDPLGNPTYTTVYKPAYTDKKQYFNNGIGIGIDLFHRDRNISPFGFNIQCGLAAYQNFTRSNFTGEMALVYKFK